MSKITTWGKASTTPRGSKVISTGKLTAVRGGSGKGIGKQTVKATRKM